MNLQNISPPPRDDSGVRDQQPPVPCRTQRILVADDYESARKTISHTLARAGFGVDVATDGEEAWAALQRGHYDLLITDNDMPRLAGLELIQRIRDAGIHLPIILISAMVSNEGLAEHAHLRIAAIIPKPFVFWDFLKIVGKTLREAAETPAANATQPDRTPAPHGLPKARVAKPLRNHVLIADDDPTVRGSLAAVLESEGYVVDEASNGFEAVTRAMQHEPDLVLLDLNMPNADGWTAFNHLEQVTPLLPVIVITARPNQYQEAVRVGVDAFMEKPLNIPVLVRAIKRLTSEDEDSHISRITNRAFVTQMLNSASAGNSTD